MSNSPPRTEFALSGNNTAGNRRSACDRCRSHKLRCDRDTLQTDCRRCLKASAKCLTGTALKSGRPQHLHGAPGGQQQWLGVQKPAQDLSYQPAVPDFPTPPSSNFNTPPAANALQRDDPGLHDLVSPISFSGLDDVWMSSFDQEMIASNSNNISITTGPLSPSDLPQEHLKKIATLQTNLLADLESVKCSRRIDQVPKESLPSDEDQTCDYLIGRTLHHSTVLLEILDYSKGSSASRVNDSRGVRDNLPCDIPTISLIVSCYICLIRIYRTIFSVLLDSIPLIPSLQTPMPQLFPGMNLGGFKLETKIDMQIQILVQVSESLLMRIEAKFGLGNDTSACVFEDSRAAGMLKMMLEEEAGEQPLLNEPREECGSLNDILADLKNMLQEERVSRNG